MNNTNYPQMKILQTKRCILRPACLEDAPDLFEYYKQEKVIKFLPLKKHTSINDTKQFIKTFFINNYKKGKIGHFVIVYKINNKVIGNVGFNNISPNAKKGEIGICINPSYWGEDLSTELATEMLRYGFDDLKLKVITAILYKENIYSKKALEILGFNFKKKFVKKNTFINLNQRMICYKYEIDAFSYCKCKNINL